MDENTKAVLVLLITSLTTIAIGWIKLRSNGKTKSDTPVQEE